MKTPITKQRLRQHLTYSSWKYLLLLAVAIFGWNIAFTVTAYRPPKEKIVDLYVYGYGETEPISAYMAKVNREEMPDMEQMTVSFLMPDDQYGMMSLSARVAAGDGDIFLLPRDVFQTTAGESWFVALDDHLTLQALAEERGVNLDRCWRKNNEEGVRHLYALPMAIAPGLAQYVYNSGDYFICVAGNNGNDENVFKFLEIMLRDLGPDSIEPAPAE